MRITDETRPHWKGICERMKCFFFCLMWVSVAMMIASATMGQPIFIATYACGTFACGAASFFFAIKEIDFMYYRRV